MPDAENATQPESTFDNEGKGALFPNDKGDNPNRPDYRGRMTLDGKEYRISGWKRKAKASGKQFLSLAFTEDVADPEGGDAFS